MDVETLIAPAVTAAAVSGIIGLVIAFVARSATLRSVRERAQADAFALERRISTDIELALQKFASEREKAISDKAWADYELRRDLYTALAYQIDCLFEGGDPTQAANIERRLELLRTARKLRLVGSDEVVRSLNALLEGIRSGGNHEEHEQRFRALFNAMRRDIRQLHSLPPEGTDLGPDAFPIEGAGLT